MVERRREQAAEDARSRPAQAGIQEGGAVVKSRQVSPDARVRLSHLLSFPLTREWIIKPLDSSLRWNDGEGRGQTFVRNSKGAVGIATIPFLPPSSFQRRLESTSIGMQVVEPRLEQATEEGDDGVPRETPIQSEFPIETRACRQVLRRRGKRRLCFKAGLRGYIRLLCAF